MVQTDLQRASVEGEIQAYWSQERVEVHVVQDLPSPDIEEA